jgi:hydroxymethylpyrimidine pyrophosphatase-like HAD family hydrolase
MKIRLLSTDFDGTLIDFAAAPQVDRELFEVLAALRSQGVLWAINTGRALRHILEGLAEHGFPLQPDFILTSERHIFRPSPALNGGSPGWEDFGPWNAQCDLAHDALFFQTKAMMAEIRSFIQKETAARFIDDFTGLGFVGSSDEEVNRILHFVDSRRIHFPDFAYQRNTLYVRFCHQDYHKGAALGELGRLLEIPREQIFAAGDHLNDLPMLDGRHARWVACPGNSAEEVKELVRVVGGHVSQGRAGTGTVEALKRFFGLAA